MGGEEEYRTCAGGTMSFFGGRGGVTSAEGKGGGSTLKRAKNFGLERGKSFVGVRISTGRKEEGGFYFGGASERDCSAFHTAAFWKGKKSSAGHRVRKGRDVLLDWLRMVSMRGKNAV